MKIGINTSGIQQTGGGGATYVRELIDGLRRAEPQSPIHEFAHQPRFSRKKSVLRAFDTLHRQAFWLQKTLPRNLREKQIDIFHNPGSQISLRCPIPMVATIHDLYVFKNPGAFRWWHQKSTQFFTRKAIERSDSIIAISAFTLSEIEAMFGSKAAEKTTIIHEAAQAQFRSIHPDELEKIIQKYQLVRPFILCVSTIEPRKNFIGILRAFARIKDRIDHELVIVGAYGWKQNKLRHEAATLRISDQVRFLGYIHADDLPAIYNLADLFAYPSFYEGFGLPILEAMACGCPVLTSNTASMPEVAGSAAMLVDPFSVNQIADGMFHVLESDSERNRLSTLGLARAGMFSWDRCAEETFKVYQTLR